MNRNKILLIALIGIYFVFIFISFLIELQPGKEIGGNFVFYFIDMIKILPFAFILIGLFETWIKRETVEKHLGEKGGFISYIWVLLLGGITIGPMLVALPVAFSLSNKGARLSVIFTYIGAAAVCRIPMTIFEASYLGIKFTIIRYAVSVPLIILSSWIMGKYLEKKKYCVNNGE